MNKFPTAACAFALALAWAIAPASAQTTAPSAEKKADQIEKKAEQKADQIESQAKKDAKDVRREGDRAADSVRGKTDGDTAGGKMDRAWEKTKAKAREVKDKVTGDDRVTTNGRMNGDVRSAQMALRDKGHNPGPIDGVMGPRTSAAIRDFQQKENLTVSGQLDAETRAKLMAGASTSGTTSTDTGRSTSAGTPSTAPGAAGAPSASPATTDRAGNPQSQKQ